MIFRKFSCVTCNSMYQSFIPSFLPVMNSQQQLSAIYLDFGAMSQSVVFSTLEHWQNTSFFDRLADISYFVSVKDLQEIPADLHTSLSGSRIVLCVSDELCAEESNHTKLNDIVNNGFRIVTDQLNTQTELLWTDARHVAVDCTNGVPLSCRPWITRLSSGQHWAKQLSSSIELEQAKQAGFTLFSGDYAFNPPAKNKAADSSARTRLLKLLGLLSRDADSDELENLIKQDPTLSFMLFKLVSSAAFSQPVRVSSFGQAISLLGRRQLQRWLQLLLYARQQDLGGALNPLMARAAFRASMMEAVFQKLGASKDDLDGAFMVGMFSLLDKLFGSALSEVLQPLQLREDILHALLYRSGKLGQCLCLVELADRTNTMALNEQTRLLELDADSYYDCICDAYVWVNQVCRDM